jgi:hydrogenase maturation protease
MSAGSARVIGIGNPLRGDDGVGCEVARRVRARGLPEVAVLDEERDGARLMDAWAGATTVVMIDATASGAPPGTIRRFDAGRHPLPDATLAASTHQFGVRDAIELARVLGTLPSRVIVYGIEGETFGPGIGLSAAVAAVVADVEAGVMSELRADGQVA